MLPRALVIFLPAIGCAFAATGFGLLAGLVQQPSSSRDTVERRGAAFAFVALGLLAAIGCVVFALLGVIAWQLGPLAAGGGD
jgi:hypothetical protein